MLGGLLVGQILRALMQTYTRNCPEAIVLNVQRIVFVDDA